MPVYIDDMKAPFHGMTMCHMIADSTDELLNAVDAIGVQRKWIQYLGKSSEHFDVCLAKKRLALKRGAIEITWRQLAIMILRREEQGILGKPEDAMEWYKKHGRGNRRNG